MHVHLQQGALSTTFSKQLLENGNEKVPIDAVTECISFPSNFCTIVPSTEQLIQNVFPQIATNCKNHERLCQRAVLASKNNDVNTINNIIQGQILSKYITYKSIDTIMNMDEIVNYSTEFLIHWTLQEYSNMYCHSKLVRP